VIGTVELRVRKIDNTKIPLAVSNKYILGTVPAVHKAQLRTANEKLRVLFECRVAFIVAQIAHVDAHGSRAVNPRHEDENACNESTIKFECGSKQPRSVASSGVERRLGTEFAKHSVTTNGRGAKAPGSGFKAQFLNRDRAICVIVNPIDTAGIDAVDGFPGRPAQPLFE